MSLIFPSSPTIGQTYSSGSSGTFVYNGTAWDSQNSNLPITVPSASFAEKSKLWYVNVTSTASYTLPSGYTVDTCRYTTIAEQVNGAGAWFNTGTYRFTPQKAGYWRITLGYDFYRGSTAETYLNIYKNSTAMAGTAGIAAIQANLTKTVYVNGTTDYIYGSNNGNATSTRTQGPAISFFEATWVGE